MTKEELENLISNLKQNLEQVTQTFYKLTGQLELAQYQLQELSKPVVEPEEKPMKNKKGAQND